MSLRCSVIGEMPKPALERIAAGGAAPGSGARTGERPVYFTGQGFVPTPAFDRRLLARGEPHRRAGARGGVRLHDRGAAGRGARGRSVRQPDDRGVRVMNESAAGRTQGLDPVLTEIIRNGLIAATEEMKTNLMRTAYNLIIYEALDFTVGLLDAQGNTVSIGLGLPMFIRGMSDTAKAKLAYFGGAAGLEPGDVLLTNDAYLTGSHLNHMTFSVPIFWQGELLGFSSCMAHWQDIGGAIGGMTADIFAEGLQMPIVKFYRAGQLERGPRPDHPHERPHPRAGNGRSARADRGGAHRREALPRARGEVRPRHRARRDRGHHGPERGGRARERARDPGRRVRGRVVPRRRRRRHRPPRPDPGEGHRRGRPDDRRPERRERPGARLLQLRRDRRDARARRSRSSASRPRSTCRSTTAASARSRSSCRPARW